MNAEPRFPPLLEGVPAETGEDPFTIAMGMAESGCDPGIVIYSISQDYLRAAIIFAPEVPLEQAMAMMVACGVGFANALGALAPPEVAVHLGWDGTIYVNGACCGGLRVAANVTDPEVEPDWLVVSLKVAIFPPYDLEGGEVPNETTLFEEGCGEIGPVRLLESWARHTLVWIHRWSDDGPAPLYADWNGIVYGIGNGITAKVAGEPVTGRFLGTDEDFGMLIKTAGGTVVKPLSELLYDRKEEDFEQ